MYEYDEKRSKSTQTLIFKALRVEIFISEVSNPWYIFNLVECSALEPSSRILGDLSTRKLNRPDLKGKRPGFSDRKLTQLCRTSIICFQIPGLSANTKVSHMYMHIPLFYRGNPHELVRTAQPSWITTLHVLRPRTTIHFIPFRPAHDALGSPLARALIADWHPLGPSARRYIIITAKVQYSTQPE